MAKIKIKDIPKETKISREEVKKVLGGAILSPTYVSLTPKPRYPIIIKPYPGAASCGCGCG